MTGAVTEPIESAGVETFDPAPQPNHSAFAVNQQFAALITLAAYCGVILVGISHHEPWADEAQAWLLSRDLSYRYLVFHQLAYDGVPPLWPTILWLASHWFHLPYQSMGWIGGLCAIVGCWFFCRHSPFPLWLRVLFPFTYFIAYQYAIVARPYVLLPLFVFASGQYFAQAESHPWKFAVATSALALLCANGVMIAVGLVAARGWYTFRAWHDIPSPTRKKLLGALIAFALVVIFVAVVNWPPADRSFARLDNPVNDGTSGVIVVPRSISVAFLGSPIPSIAFMIVVGAWCASRRRFLPFVLPMALMLAFFAKVYVNLWHCGTLTLVAVAALWIAWPSTGKFASSKVQRAVNILMLAALLGFFAVHIYWTASTLALDYSHPYSGSLDAARFLRSVGADASPTCGFGFHSCAVQPYFRENIFQNWPRGEAFWRFEERNRVDQSCSILPKWVVLPICCQNLDASVQDFYQNDRRLRSYGYIPAHTSQGSIFFEGRVVEQTSFVIYKRER